MTKQSIEFEVDGQKLRGRLYKPDGKAKKLALLFIHGWTGKPNDTAAAIMAKHGFWALTFSLSGHNDSDSKIEEQTRQKSLREAVAAYDFLKVHIPSNTEIAAVGNSYGGYMTLLLTAERPVVAISLRVASNYVDEHFDEKQLGQGSENKLVFQWRHLELDYQVTRALRALHDFSGWIQIIEAGLDDAVPHQSTLNYVNAVKSKNQLEYNFMKGWPHSLGDHKERNKEFQKMLLNWAQKVSEQL